MPKKTKIAAALAMTALVALGGALSGCGTVTDGTPEDDDKISVSQPVEGTLVFAAEEPSTGSSLSTLVVGDSQGVAVDADVKSGTFRVSVLGENESTLYCDTAFTSAGVDIVPDADGKCAVRVETEGAVGSVRVYVYNLDEGMDGADAVEDDGLDWGETIDEGTPQPDPSVAARDAGIPSFDAPDTAGAGGQDFSEPVYETDNDTVIATYRKDDMVLTLRKSLVFSGADLAGDGRGAPDVWEVPLPFGTATCHGFRDRGAVWASWDANDAHYTVSASGANETPLYMSDEDVIQMAVAAQ